MSQIFHIETDANTRLDHWLTQKFPKESRSFWQKKIKNGEILINSKKTKAHYALRINDTVKINLISKAPTLKPEKIPLNIIFEDKNYAIIDKPAGLVVHPGSGNKEHTLVHALIHHFGKNLSTSDPDRPGIVHRLDKDTSGLLIVAKNNQAHRFFTKQFEEKTIQKTYLALIDGRLNPTKGSIEAPLNRSRQSRQKISISTSKGSRYALTHYEIEKYFSSPIPCSLARVKIETGRTHQIRVHFESIGFPVLGDATYGHHKKNAILEELGLKRQFLHATELEFISPTTQKNVKYKSPIPKELAGFIKNLS